MIGGQDLKFNDLHTIDFLLQNKIEPTKGYNNYAKRGMSMAAAPEMAMMADDANMDMTVNSNALDSLFVYKMDSIDLQPKSRSSQIFQPKVNTEFE